MKSNIYAAMVLLAKAVQERYPLFASAYPLTKTDFTKGLVLSYDKKKWIALSDTEGNYFYIRIEPSIPVSFSPNRGFADSGIDVTEQYNCVLVAVVSSDIDEIDLKDALTAEILLNDFVVTAGSFDAISIMRNELKGMKKESIESAISRMYGKSIASVTFRYSRSFSSSNCTLDLCRC